jgi:Cu(I)/Ag(I) efflux system membrane protein CusA/SilA
MEAIKKSNRDVEGRVLELSGIEYMVRGRGYIKNLQDLEDIPVGDSGAGTPVYLKDIARIQLGPRSGGALLISTARVRWQVES